MSVWGNHGPTVVFLFDAICPIHTNICTETVMSLAGTATGRLFATYLPGRLIEESLLEDERRLGLDIAAPVDREEFQAMVNDVHK